MISLGSGVLMGLFTYQCYLHASIILGHTSLSFTPAMMIIMSIAIGFLTFTLLQDALKDNIAAWFLTLNDAQKATLKTQLNQTSSPNIPSTVQAAFYPGQNGAQPLSTDEVATILSNIAQDEAEFNQWQNKFAFEGAFSPSLSRRFVASLKNRPGKAVAFTLITLVALVGLGAGIKEWLTSTHQLLSALTSAPVATGLCAVLGTLVTIGELIFTVKACLNIVDMSTKKDKSTRSMGLLIAFGVLAAILNAIVNAAIGMGQVVTATSVVLGTCAGLLSAIVMIGNLALSSSHGPNLSSKRNAPSMLFRSSAP